MSTTSPAAPTNTARHAANAHTPPWLLTMRFATRLQWGYLARIPSNQAWMILTRKYDAFTTDRAYENLPRSWMGPLGRWADQRVLDYPVHVALRQRLDIVTSELHAAVGQRLTAGADPVRVLSAPSGLCRDLIHAAERLRQTHPDADEHVDWHCLDIDASGDVIPEATRRLDVAGMNVTFHREDLFGSRELRELADRGRTFHVVNSQGLTAWVPIDDVARLAATYRSLMPRDGTLLVDNFAWHEHSAMGADLEIDTIYHPPEEFEATIKAAGFRIDAIRQTGNRVCTVYVAIAI